MSAGLELATSALVLSSRMQRLNHQSNAKRGTDAVDRVEARRAAGPQGFVQRFPGDACRLGDLGHAAGAGNVSSPAAKLAQLGAPIDAEKIAAIRTAIAEGRYPVDPKAIATKMVDLDLPAKF